MQRVRQPRDRIFAFERLEARTVLSGTVTIVTPSQHFFELVGDRANNAIAVHQVGINRADGGAIIQVVGLGTKIMNAQTGKTGTSLKFGTGAGVTVLAINLGGGNDNLNLYNTTISQGLSIETDDLSQPALDGNDVVNVSNVSCGLFSLSLGGGNNVAVVTNVSATPAGFGAVSGNGNNTLVLNKVNAGGNLLIVILGNADSVGLNNVAVVNCTAGSGVFTDPAPKGVLSGVGNSFDAQTVDTFQFRFGDLVSDKQ